MARRRNNVTEPVYSDPREPVVVGYARVSTFEQNLDLQIAALKRAGVSDKYLFVDKMSAVKGKRPNFQLVKEILRRGDTLIIYSLSRLARSLADLITFELDLRQRGITLKSLTEHIDTSTAVGKLAFNMQGAFAQFERDITIERTIAGIETRREQGLSIGRPRDITQAQLDAIRKDLMSRRGKDGPYTYTVEQVAAKHKVTKERIRYYFRGGRAVIEREMKRGK
jgi:DNA invertase Pin-like site-specific DNA recombinase